MKLITLTSLRNSHKVLFWIVVLFTIVILVTAQDLLHSTTRNHSFYISESLLFGTFWLIFVPLILLSKTLVKTKNFLLLSPVITLIHVSLFSLIVFFISALFFYHSFGIYRTFVDTISKYGIVCILMYSLSCFLFSRNQSPLKEQKDSKVSKKIKVISQNKVIFLDCNDILYVKSDKPYISLVTEHKKFLYNSSLKNFLLENKAPNFVQIHKSTIINTDYIISYTSRKNGDYDIELTNKHIIRASRNFNSNFKPIFDNITLG